MIQTPSTWLQSNLAKASNAAEGEQVQKLHDYIQSLPDGHREKMWQFQFDLENGWGSTPESRIAHIATKLNECNDRMANIAADVVAQVAIQKAMGGTKFSL